jgi:solute carrier family 66, member 2
VLTFSPNRIFYWFGAHFDTALLIQAVIMIIMQCLLLQVALTHRPLSPIAHQPFSSNSADLEIPRPYNFWRWGTARPFWTFIIYFTVSLFVLQMLLSSSEAYTSLLGAVALAVEATLPIPQILANHQRRCCKGFRLSVLVNWLVGDAFKMVFFFAKGAHDVPWAFKLCGVFQASCDVFLGVQYFMFGDGEPILDLKQESAWAGQNGVEMVDQGGAWEKIGEQKS